MGLAGKWAYVPSGTVCTCSLYHAIYTCILGWCRPLWCEKSLVSQVLHDAFNVRGISRKYSLVFEGRVYEACVKLFHSFHYR